MTALNGQLLALAENSEAVDAATAAVPPSGQAPAKRPGSLDNALKSLSDCLD